MKVKNISIKNREGVRANARSNRIKYLAAKLFPKQFGLPLHVQFVLTDTHTGKQRVINQYNTVTTAGKNMIADRLLASPSLGVPTHMAIGTGTGGTTSLNTELDRNAFTTKTRSNAVVTMVGDWAAGDGTGALTEAGIFDASSSGNMHTYTTFSVINKAAADALTITWTITIS